MIRKGVKFRFAPALENACYDDYWGETEKVELRGEIRTVYKHICYTGGRRDGERIENNYSVPLRVYRKRPNRRAHEVQLKCRDGKTRTFYTLPEPVEAHSRTNMAYGTTKKRPDGGEWSKVYWFEDGAVFSTSSTWYPSDRDNDS